MLCLFVNAEYEWNVTKTNPCVHLNVTGEYPCILVYNCYSVQLNLKINNHPTRGSFVEVNFVVLNLYLQMLGIHVTDKQG